MARDVSAEVAVDDGERAPLGVVIGVAGGTVALAAMLGIVSAGTMNGMKSNAVERVRAEIMAGSPAATEVVDDNGTDDETELVDGHIVGVGTGGAVDVGQGAPVDDKQPTSADGSASSSDGVDAVVPSSVSTSGQGASGASSSDTVYDVKRGDTLSDISRKYGVSVDEIATANGIWNPDLIYADSSLKIPGAMR